MNDHKVPITLKELFTLQPGDKAQLWNGLSIEVIRGPERERVLVRTKYCYLIYSPQGSIKGHDLFSYALAYFEQEISRVRDQHLQDPSPTNDQPGLQAQINDLRRELTLLRGLIENHTKGS